MKPTRIAIATPAFNRAKEFSALFESLKAQVCQEFAWCVVDDGSVDDSWAVINAMAHDVEFSGLAFRKENGGRRAVINLVLRSMKEPLTLLVNSDNALPPGAVKTVLRFFDLILKEQGVSGISSLKRMKNASQEIRFPKTWLKGTYVDVCVNGRIGGDCAEVFHTDCLKESPFPEFPGERFCHEDGVWVLVSSKYEMYHVNEVVDEGSYLESRPILNGRALKMASPLGMCDRAARFLGYPRRIIPRQRVKYALLRDVYSVLAKRGGTFSVAIHNFQTHYMGAEKEMDKRGFPCF